MVFVELKSIWQIKYQCRHHILWWDVVCDIIFVLDVAHRYTNVNVCACLQMCVLVRIRSREIDISIWLRNQYTCPLSHIHVLSFPVSIYLSVPINVKMLRILLGRTLIKAHIQNLSLNDPHRLSAERKIEDWGKESGESLQMLSTFSQLSEYFFRHEFAFDTIPVVLYYILTFTLPIPHDDGKHVSAMLAVWWTFWKSFPCKFTCAVVLTCSCSFRWLGMIPRLSVRTHRLNRFFEILECDVNVSAKALQVMKFDIES